MLLVLFLHPRALLSLPQCSHISDTGSSRAPLKTASVGQHGVSAMECIVVYWSRDKFPIPFTLYYLCYHQRGSLESMSHILQHRLIFSETHTGYILPWSLFNPTYQVDLICVVKNERRHLLLGSRLSVLSYH